jgi:hypothetical protein
MRIYITESQLSKLVEQSESKSPKEQFDEFLYYEDKVKSSFIGKKKIIGWYNILKEKYPSLRIRIQNDGDVIRAEAEIDRNKIMEEITNNNSETEDFTGKRVMVHYNLHKHTFSVTYKNKVILHADYVKLSDVEFRVRPGGNDRVRKEKSKNVHAFVIGTLLDYCEFPCDKIPDESNENIVTYDPYKYNSFVYKSSKEPVYNAKEVDMINKKNKLFVIQEIKN